MIFLTYLFLSTTNVFTHKCSAVNSTIRACQQCYPLFFHLFNVCDLVCACIYSCIYKIYSQLSLNGHIVLVHVIRLFSHFTVTEHSLRWTVKASPNNVSLRES